MKRPTRCTVPDCTTPGVKARGLCHRHWQAWRDSPEGKAQVRNYRAVRNKRCGAPLCTRMARSWGGPERAVPLCVGHLRLWHMGADWQQPVRQLRGGLFTHQSLRAVRLRKPVLALFRALGEARGVPPEDVAADVLEAFAEASRHAKAERQLEALLSATAWTRRVGELSALGWAGEGGR